MNIKDRVQHLCRQRKVTMSELETELGFARGYLSKLNATNPTVDKILKIADYFGVSTDYLITGNGSCGSPAPTELQAIYDGLDDYDRETLMRVARALASKDSCSSRS